MIILRMFKNLRQPPRGSCGDLCGQTKVAHDRCQLPWTPEEGEGKRVHGLDDFHLSGTFIMIMMIIDHDDHDDDDQSNQIIFTSKGKGSPLQ